MYTVYIYDTFLFYILKEKKETFIPLTVTGKKTD